MAFPDLQGRRGCGPRWVDTDKPGGPGLLACTLQNTLSLPCRN